MSARAGWEEIEGDGAPLIDRRRRFVVAVYELDRRWGGPEEGGWWWDSGELVRVVSVEKSAARASEVARRINRSLAFKRERSGARPLHSMAYEGGHLSAEVHEGTAPQSWPAQRPYYE